MQPLEQLPHLIVEEPKRSKAAVVSIIIISIILLSLPVGLFMVGNPQKFFSSASVEEIRNPKFSMELVASQQNANSGQEQFIDVEIKSDGEFINMAEAVIGYDPALVQITAVLMEKNGVKSYADKWLSRGFSKEKGEVILVGGNAAPGVITKESDTPLFFARIAFKTLGEGNAAFSLKKAALYKNSDNTNVLMTKKDAVISISAGGVSGQVEPGSSASHSITGISIQSPQTGEVFYYFRPLDITWSGSFNTVREIRLLINGELFASLGENMENTGKFTWTPSNTVPAPYITKATAFQIEIEGSTENGEIVKTMEGPVFGLLTDPEGKLVSNTGGQIKQTLDAEITDGSRILSRFGSDLKAPDVLDLNGDLVLNELDLALLRKSLRVKDQVL